MKRKKYEIEVEFTYSTCVKVYAEDVDDAMAQAEDKAFEIFADELNKGLIGPEDFIANAQEP